MAIVAHSRRRKNRDDYDLPSESEEQFGRRQDAPRRRGALCADISRQAARLTRAASEAAASADKAPRRMQERGGRSKAAAGVSRDTARSVSPQDDAGPAPKKKLVGERVDGVKCHCGGNMIAHGDNEVQSCRVENGGTGYERVPFACDRCHIRFTRYGLRQLKVEQTALSELARNRRLYEVPSARLRQCLIDEELETKGCMEDFMRELYSFFSHLDAEDSKPEADAEISTTASSRGSSEEAPNSKRAKVVDA